MDLEKIFKKNNIVLSIETSFNDTCCSILRGNHVLSNIIYTQNHSKFRGVKPRLAYDMHLKKIYEVVRKSIIKSGISLNRLNAIAYTKGPGLVGSLMIGENFAKSLSLSLGKKIVSVNHIHGHIFSIYLYNKKKIYPSFPFLCLSISGGHTKLFIVNSFFNIIEIGKTLDESLGRLFDKTSVLLGFNYLDGAQKIEKLAKDGKFIYSFPISHIRDFNFSFSGLMTYIKNKIKLGIVNKLDFCRSLIETIIIILKKKINYAISKTGIKNIVITGGVSSNKILKKKLKIDSIKKKYRLFYNSSSKYLKDNAAIIGLVAQIKYYYNIFDSYNKILINSKININQI